MDFNFFIEWAFYGIISLSAIMGIKILTQLRDSIDKLNIKVARILEKTSWHEKELDNQNKRINKLEERINRM